MTTAKETQEQGSTLYREACNAVASLNIGEWLEARDILRQALLTYMPNDVIADAAAIDKWCERIWPMFSAEFTDDAEREAMRERLKRAVQELAPSSNAEHQQRIKQLTEERDALAREMLTPKVFQRLLHWLRSDPIKSARNAFTAGIERQIAYSLEPHVLAEIKRLRTELGAVVQSSALRTAVLQWLAESDDVGVSSKTIAIYLSLGVKPRGACHPLDPADFNRCLKLLKVVPELKPLLPRMRDVSPAWEKLIGRWDEVETTLLDEVGLDWCKDPRKHARKTYDLMREINP